MPARILSTTGAGRGYIPVGHRRNWDRSLCGVDIRAHHPSLTRNGGRHRLPDTFDPVLTSHFKEATWQASLSQSTEEDQSDWSKALDSQQLRKSDGLRSVGQR
ncbi:hypothetical protein Bbelb_001980 [Branchiostoma belcheri]|nr:hypothetical protein Bbelb_001980 [Branchiostoma belcheri]